MSDNVSSNNVHADSIVWPVPIGVVLGYKDGHKSNLEMHEPDDFSGVYNCRHSALCRMGNSPKVYYLIVADMRL